MIDRLFQTVQAALDKEQVDYLRPIYFNLYVNASLIEVFNKLISDVKSNVRKENWMLDGKNLADFSEYTKQLLEYYLATSQPLTRVNNYFLIPSDCTMIQDVYNDTTPVEKVDLDDYNLLARNTESAPTINSPICSKIGSTLIVSPAEIEQVVLYYLRKPKKAKWTFEEVQGKPMFDPTKQDFQDIDAPEVLFDELYYSILAKAGVSTRDQLVVQSAIQEENQNLQQENKQ